MMTWTLQYQRPGAEFCPVCILLQEFRCAGPCGYRSLQNLCFRKEMNEADSWLRLWWMSRPLHFRVWILSCPCSIFPSIDVDIHAPLPVALNVNSYIVKAHILQP